MRPLVSGEPFRQAMKRRTEDGRSSRLMAMCERSIGVICDESRRPLLARHTDRLASQSEIVPCRKPAFAGAT